ncbi:hypothetical protein [Priestia megaterium]|uniref:hypothetical protein n=1 Tax=Priestia megaterium TaxID=1404 RepID=UPI002E218C5C|nr:hypothetical protein [Priestia megaterium]MED4102139.1 hypothetical protein [Priestia megaterium]MED4142646.1 hypothetical protein [Priestia megaterium]
MQKLKELDKIHAVVEISMAYENLTEDLYPAYKAGLGTIYDTFSCVDDLHNIAEKLIENTPIEGEDGEEAQEIVLNAFLENTHDLRKGTESKSEFYSRFFLFNPKLADKLTLEDKINLTFDLAAVDWQLSQKLSDLEAARVTFNVFSADHIIDCINVIWDYDVSVYVKGYLADPEKDKIELRSQLTNIYNGIKELFD